MFFQGPLAREPYNLQHAEPPSDERLPAAGLQAAARAGTEGFTRLHAGPLPPTQPGRAEAPLTQRRAR